MQRDPVPDRFASIEDFTEFWDTHDITDYPEVWRETDIKVSVTAPAVILRTPCPRWHARGRKLAPHNAVE
jgi:hypothetical protein